MDYEFLSNVDNYKIDEDPGPFSKIMILFIILRKMGLYIKVLKSKKKTPIRL